MPSSAYSTASPGARAPAHPAWRQQPHQRQHLGEPPLLAADREHLQAVDAGIEHVCCRTRRGMWARSAARSASSNVPAASASIASYTWPMNGTRGTGHGPTPCSMLLQHLARLVESARVRPARGTCCRWRRRRSSCRRSASPTSRSSVLATSSRDGSACTIVTACSAAIKHIRVSMARAIANATSPAATRLAWSPARYRLRLSEAWRCTRSGPVFFADQADRLGDHPHGGTARCAGLVDGLLVAERGLRRLLGPAVAAGERRTPADTCPGP